MSALRKNVASQVVTFALVNATTGAALTGATVTTKVALDGTQAASAGTLTELGSGQYKYVPTQGETNGASVGFLFTATNAVPVNLHCFTTSQDPTIAQTGDAYARLGAPAGASIAADIAAVPTAAANADAVWDEALSGHTTAGTAGKKLGDLSTATPLDAAGVRSAIGLASANLDTQLTAIDDFVDTEVAAIYNRIGAPAGASIAADIAGITATVNAADVRAALGMASANLDTQLAALPTAAENAGAVWDEVRAGHVAAGSFGEGIANIKTKTDYLPSATAGDAGGVFIAGANAATSVATAFTANIAGSMSGNVEGNVNGSVGSVVGNVDGSVASVVGLTAANLDVAVSTRLADANTQSQVRAAVGMASANLDAQLGTIAGYLDTEVAAIKAKTDLIPASPSTLDAAGVRAAVGLASANLDTQLGTIAGYIDTEVGAIYSRLGAPAGASMSADIAAVKAVDDAIKAKTDNLPAAPASTTNITAAAGIALSAGERSTLADAIFDRTDGATSGYTLRKALEVMLAVLAGKLSGAATATITIRDINDTKNVLVVSTDSSGNRTAATVTP